MSIKETEMLDCPVCCFKFVNGAGEKVLYPKKNVDKKLASLFKEIIFCGNCALGMAYPGVKEKEAINNINDSYMRHSGWKVPKSGRIPKHALIHYLLAERRWRDIEKALSGSYNGNTINVLDVGSGYGFIGLFANKSNAFSLIKYTCVEPDKKMGKYTIRLWNKQTKENKLEIKENLQDVNEKYEVVVLSHVLEHVIKPLDMVKTAVSCLNENGILLVDVPNQDYKFKRDVFPHLLFFTKDSLDYALKQEKSISIISLFTYGANIQNSPLCKRLPFSTRLLLQLSKIAKFFLTDNILSLFYIRLYGIDNINPNGTWIRAICKKLTN